MNRLTVLLCLSAYGLTSCTMDNTTQYTSYEGYNYTEAEYRPQIYGYNPDMQQSQYQSTGQVTVPESYHVGAYHSPVSHKDRDKSWVANQNPQAYTIEIAEGEKASQVAGKLYNAPKGDRRAQIKYYQNGTPYYKGVYGSYNSYEEAQKAYNALPATVKQGAGIKNWSSVQQNMGGE